MSASPSSPDPLPESPRSTRRTCPRARAETGRTRGATHRSPRRSSRRSLLLGGVFLFFATAPLALATAETLHAAEYLAHVSSNVINGAGVATAIPPEAAGSHALLITQLALITVLLAISGCLSGAETALFSLGNPTLNRWRSSGTPKQKLAARLMADHHGTLTAILLGNNFVNILASILFGRITGELLAGSDIDAERGKLIAGFVITLFVLVFSEITPKSIAYALSHQLAPIVALPLSWMIRILSPAIYILKGLSTRVLQLIGTPDDATALSVDEYQTWIGLGCQLGVFSGDEEKLLQQVFKLRTRPVSSAMTPRVDMQAVDISTSAAELEHIIRQYRHRRLPVINGDLDTIVGVLQTKTFTLAEPDARADWVNRCVNKPVFIPEQAELSRVLARFRAEDLVMAFIVDEFGGIAGLVTVEDILEQIVGDLADEYDEHRFQISQLAADHWRVNGQMAVTELLDHVPFELPDHDADTLGGLLAEMLDHIPNTGESWDCAGYRFLIRRVDGLRIQEIDIFAYTPPVPDPVASDTDVAASGSAPPDPGSKSGVKTRPQDTRQAHHHPHHRDDDEVPVDSRSTIPARFDSPIAPRDSADILDDDDDARPDSESSDDREVQTP